jgi:hypothetical protein
VKIFILGIRGKNMQNSIYVENNINMDKEKRGLNADSDWKTRKKYKKQVDDPKKKTG